MKNIYGVSLLESLISLVLLRTIENGLQIFRKQFGALLLANLHENTNPNK